MSTRGSGYGLWSLVVINSAVFILFRMTLTFFPKWRSLRELLSESGGKS